MAVVLGTTITLASLLSMAASAGAVAADIARVAQALKDKGHPADAPVPLPDQLAVQKALDALPQPLPADFGQLAAADQGYVSVAIEAVRRVYIADEQVGEYRAKALADLYAFAQFLDLHP